MKYQFHPTSYHHEQHEHHLDYLDHLEHLDHLKQLEQMQLHPSNHQSNFNNQQHYLTIEDIKSTRNSCWLCGCNWLEDHISLDCPECDGYALSRPCPNCDGKCQQTWTRNISATHDRHKALWVGQCKFQSKQAAGTMSEADRFKAAAQAAAAIITSNKQMMFTAACGSPFKAGKASATMTTQQMTTANNASGANLTVAPSSCCSSQPSSAATSDEEPDDLSPK